MTGFGIMEKLKYVPYKIGEPKRLMALLIGVVGLAAGYAVEGKQSKWKAGWKMFLMSFGAVSVAAFIAGVVNPVTIYNKSMYGAPVGQTDPKFGYSPIGVQYNAYGYQPAVSGNDYLLPAMGTSGGIPVPGVRAMGEPSEGGQGYTEGQTNPSSGYVSKYNAYFEPSRSGLYNAPNVVGPDPLTGSGQVPPGEGSIYIRDLGEVDFNGGI